MGSFNNKRNLLLIIILTTFCTLSVFTRYNKNSFEETFITGVFSSGQMSVCIATSFILSMYKGVFAVPNYIWTCCSGGIFIAIGFTGWLDQENSVYFGLLGTAIVLSSLVHPLTHNQKPLFPKEIPKPKPRRGTEYLQEVLQEKWGGRVKSVGIEDLRKFRPTHGILWFIEEFGSTPDSLMEIYHISKTNPQKRLSDIVGVYKTLIVNEGEELGDPSYVVRDRNKELGSQKCPGKFFLSRRSWQITTHGIAFCKASGILVVYCKPSLANDNKRK
jgi:hypothetical protein